MGRLGAIACLLAFASCSGVVSSRKLSSRGEVLPGKVDLSTGASPRPFKTLGFIQVRGYGVEVAGFAELGDAGLDHTVRNVMANEAAKMGGDGVVHIEFLDENPSTDFERFQAASRSIQNVANPDPKAPRGVEQTDRYVTATGEVIQFLE
jgi:hypothetical protein